MVGATDSFSPIVTGTTDLGTSSLKWRDGFFVRNVDIDGILDVLGVVDLHAPLDMNANAIQKVSALDMDGDIDMIGSNKSIQFKGTAGGSEDIRIYEASNQLIFNASLAGFPGGFRCQHNALVPEPDNDMQLGSTLKRWTQFHLIGFAAFSATTTPTAPVANRAHQYLKSNKMIFQYLDGATVRYKYLDLTGTGDTWVHTTTAP